MDDEATTRDHVGSLERGLAVMEILAAHPAGLTLTEMAEEAGLTRAGARRFLLTLAATGYATQSGRLFLAVAAPADRRAHLARRRLAVDLCRTHHARGRGASSTNPAPRRCCRARMSSMSRAFPAAASSACRSMSAPGCRPLHLDGARAACRGCGTDDLKAFLAEAKIERRTPKTITSRAALGQGHRRGEGGRLCHRRRGTGARPALDRGADLRPRRQDRGGDQCLDAVGAVFRRGDGAGNPAGAADGEAADRGIFLRLSSRLGSAAPIALPGTSPP